MQWQSVKMKKEMAENKKKAMTEMKERRAQEKQEMKEMREKLKAENEEPLYDRRDIHRVIV